MKRLGHLCAFIGKKARYKLGHTQLGLWDWCSGDFQLWGGSWQSHTQHAMTSCIIDAGRTCGWVFFLVFLLLFLICSAPSALLMKYNIIARLFLWTRPRCFWISLQSQTLSQLADKICYFVLLKKHYDLLRNAQSLCESSVSVAFLFFIYSRYWAKWEQRAEGALWVSTDALSARGGSTCIRMLTTTIHSVKNVRRLLGVMAPFQRQVKTPGPWCTRA